MSPRRRLLVVAVSFVALALVGLGLMLRFAGVTAPSGGAAQDRPGHVLLVTGYGGGRSALDHLAAALRGAGRDATVVAVVADGTGDLREQAQALKAAADRALAGGSPSVDVVGFSAGGVVVRLWADELGGAAVARRIVTLGSPHHGAELAALGAGLTSNDCPEACQQLVPGSELLAGLEETPSGPVWTTVWTADDRVVTPPDSARLAGAVNVELQDICPDARVAHGQLPTDPLPVGIVALALAVEPLEVAPTSTQCAHLTAAGAAVVAAQRP